MSRDQTGQATVELALCLPLVAVLMAVVVQVGIVVADHVRVWHAAREAARIAAVDPDENAIRRAAEGAGVGPLEIVVEPSDLYRRQGEPVTVAVSYSPSTRVPILGRLLESFTLDAEASMRIEEP